MTTGDRRTLAELIARYKLEPSLRDVYVEGPRDVQMVRWWSSENGLFAAAVYEIDTVAIPLDLLQRLGFSQNRRGCVLAVGYALEQALGAEAKQPTCVVDSDFDFLLEAEGLRSQSTGLALVLRTDYSSMEMYLFRAECIAKYLGLVCGIDVHDVDAFLAALTRILTWLFCVRAANETLALGMAPVAVEKSLERTGGALRLDPNNYLRRYLTSNGRASIRNAFAREVDRHAAAAVGDPRRFMHGHDFLSVLGWYVRKCARKFRSAASEVVETGVWGCCESRHLACEELFVLLKARIAG